MLINPQSLEGRLKDPGPGEHLWIFTVAFRLSDQTARAMAADSTKPLAEPVIFDHENLLTPPVPGCYKCEEPFSRYLFHRKCTGNMGEWPDA